jgi:hypothetical protein
LNPLCSVFLSPVSLSFPLKLSLFWPSFDFFPHFPSFQVLLQFQVHSAPLIFCHLTIRWILKFSFLGRKFERTFLSVS